MRKIIALIAIFASVTASAQSKSTVNIGKAENVCIGCDTAKIRDTVYVPVFEMYDTVAVQFLYKGKKDEPHFATGYAILGSFKYYLKDEKVFKPYTKPQLVQILDEKKNVVKPDKIIRLL